MAPSSTLAVAPLPPRALLILFSSTPLHPTPAPMLLLAVSEATPLEDPSTRLGRRTSRGCSVLAESTLCTSSSAPMDSPTSRDPTNFVSASPLAPTALSPWSSTPPPPSSRLKRPLKVQDRRVAPTITTTAARPPLLPPFAPPLASSPIASAPPRTSSPFRLFSAGRKRAASLKVSF